MLHRALRTSRSAAFIVAPFLLALLSATTPSDARAQSGVPITVNPNQPATVATPAAAAPAATNGTPTNFTGQWRSPNGELRPAGTTVPANNQFPVSNVGTRINNGLTPIGGTPRAPIAKVTSGNGTLPNKEGQIWREYDISPYTARVTSTNRPEQALVDWVLRETGYEAWHSNVVSILSADARVLRVYHTPDVQAVVADVVERFLNSQGESQVVNVRVVSVSGPNWRTRAQAALQPVPVQTQGISAWLIARENASLLVTELRKRSDFREHSAPQLFISSGQSSVVSLTRPRPYTADIVMRPDAWPGYEAKASQFDEGFSIEISPLSSLDGRSIDAVVKVNIDQLERLQTLPVEVPSAVAPRQRTEIAVPQVSQFRLHDRFRWPADQVLVVSLGVVPIPSATEASAAGGFRMPAMLSGGPDRGEMLLFIDSRSPTSTAAAPTPTVQTPSLTPIVGGLPNMPLTPSRARY
ncbi:MAG: hypothetical protein K8U03_22945 [Planctomycetia bacterium]|nr:hypothetical protein [Planctomycetia bacterium]